MVVMKRELGLLKPSEAETKLLDLFNSWWAENKATYLVGGDSALFTPSTTLPDTVLRFIQGPSRFKEDPDNDPMDVKDEWEADQDEEEDSEDETGYEDGTQSYEGEEDEEEQGAAAPPPPPARLTSVVKKPKLAVSFDPHAGHSSSSRRVDSVSSDTEAPYPPKRRFVGDGYSSVRRSYRDATVSSPPPKDRKRERSPSQDLRSRLRENRETRDRGGQEVSSRHHSSRRDDERYGSSSRAGNDNGRSGDISHRGATSDSREDPTTQYCKYFSILGSFLSINFCNYCY